MDRQTDRHSEKQPEWLTYLSQTAVHAASGIEGKDYLHRTTPGVKAFQNGLQAQEQQPITHILCQQFYSSFMSTASPILHVNSVTHTSCQHFNSCFMSTVSPILHVYSSRILYVNSSFIHTTYFMSTVLLIPQVNCTFILHVNNFTHTSCQQLHPYFLSTVY